MNLSFYFCRCFFILKYFWVLNFKRNKIQAAIVNSFPSFLHKTRSVLRHGLLLQGSMKKGGIIEHFFWLNLRIYELTFNNYSVSPYFPYIFCSYIYMKQNWIPIFAVSSNFTLEVLYNGSGCELFSQSALYISLWSEKKL